RFFLFVIMWSSCSLILFYRLSTVKFAAALGPSLEITKIMVIAGIIHAVLQFYYSQFVHHSPFESSPVRESPLRNRGLARKTGSYEGNSKSRNGAGKGNRTLIASLEGWSFT